MLDAAFKVHRTLGPGLLESAYQSCLAYEMQKQGLLVQKDLVLPLVYDDIKLDCGYRIDILAERKVIVEVKSIECFHNIHIAQLLTYMKLSGIKLGYLINFNVQFLKNGIRRLISGQLDMLE